MSLPANTPTLPPGYSEQMLNVLGILRRRYEPRPTPWSGKSDEEQTRISQEWIVEFARAQVSPTDVGWAISTWAAGFGGEYCPSYTDLNRLIHERAREARREEARELRNSSCDGTGWTTGDDGRARPCHRCNPAVWQVFQDADKRARFEQGVTLDHLDVGVVKISGKLEYEAGMPQPCLPARPQHDPESAVVGPDIGVPIARAAYEAECRAQGREPNERFFESMMGGGKRDDRVSAGTPAPGRPVDESDF